EDQRPALSLPMTPCRYPLDPMQTVLSYHPRPPAPSTLFPYTTLFRSSGDPRSGRSAGRSRSGLRQGDQGGSRGRADQPTGRQRRSEEHTSELQSREKLVCRLLLEKKKSFRATTLSVQSLGVHVNSSAA